MEKQLGQKISQEAYPRLVTFGMGGEVHAVRYVVTENVAPGVKCDVYSFPDDISKDLGIIQIEPGFKTPL